MATLPNPDRQRHGIQHHRRHGNHGFLQRWFYANTFIAGVLALVWLILRSGTKPSRLAYPCQQAAISAAGLALGAPVVAAILAMRRQLLGLLRSRAALAVLALGLLGTLGVWGTFGGAGTGPDVSRAAPLEYEADLYHVTECPQSPVGDHFVGLDRLITLMGRNGTKFYNSATESLTSGPGGIVAADDTVVIKINYQWDQRGGTNTDVLRGLIRRIVDHPDTFVGEVVVAENAQFNNTYNFNYSQNNAQVISQSPQDVVADFQQAGETVSTFDWTLVRNTQVQEYDAGDVRDGYVVYGYDSQLQGRISYPKFRTDYGTYISLRDGIWDDISETYDLDHLKFINVPVLKSHSATYGATACVKHHMGTVSGNLNTSSHSAIYYGLLGALMAEIRPPDLNVLDCIWINANPNGGPWTTYAEATRRDMLVASVDPIATDLWSVLNILIPTFMENGYSPPWPYPSADPLDPNSQFRRYLDNSMDYLLDAGYDVTNDKSRINAYHWNGDGDADLDADVDADDFVVFGDCYGGPDVVHPPGCEVMDFDDDGDVDCDDYDGFAEVWTEPGPPPEFTMCSMTCLAAGDCADFDGDGVRDDGCVWWACQAGGCASTSVPYADLGGFGGACEPDGVADINDRFHALNCFGNQDTQTNPGYPCEEAAPVAFNVDAAGLNEPCVPDGVCDANDAFAAINAFDGSTSCSCGGGPGPDLGPQARVLEQTGLRLVASRRSARPGQLLEVDVLLDGPLQDIRGYQLHLGVDGGRRGALRLVDIVIDPRKDHVYAGTEAWQAFNLQTAQMTAGLDARGVSAASGAYLATFIYQAGKAASGEFVVEILADAGDPGQRTVLFPTSQGGRIAIAPPEPLTIAVRR